MTERRNFRSSSVLPQGAGNWHSLETVDKESFQLIGEAYVHGLMYGEVVERVDGGSNEFTTTVFTIP